VKGKSEIEDKPKSRFPNKRDLERQETARLDRQRRENEEMEAIRPRISGQSLGTMRAGPPEPHEAGEEWVVQWDKNTAWRLRMSQRGLDV
jgi:hypothetical protein